MTTLQASPVTSTVRLKIALRGAVQGVGFRPFVYRLAQDLGLAGWVSNSSLGVLIEVEGPRPVLDQFLLRLDSEKPPRSFIQSLESCWLDATGYAGFEIRQNEDSGAKTVLVLPDIATCPDCLGEIFDPANRRHRYPFTNCTHCGPRFSIIDALPYDRANTVMRKFKMCPACQAEYEDPANRRFHAQPNACPVCGPHLELWSGRTGVPPVSSFGSEDARHTCPAGDAALLAAAEAIRSGRIVAAKGIGGFHLLVDARNEEAVHRLRERKHREEKPLALLFPSMESVKAVCEVSPLEERLLHSPEAPIVLLGQIANRQSSIANEVAPGNPNLGVMLPSNPLHHLLMAELGFPIVATSGNLSDEPICTDEHEVLERLGDIADSFLVHNRPIVRHVDDSIVRVMLDRELVLRRARGYAPLPITLQPAIRSPQSAITLAVGAHLKNSVALSVGPQVFISQHIGDLETEQADNAFRRVIADFEKLYEVMPEVVATDLHPDYLSTRFADVICRSSGSVQAGDGSFKGRSGSGASGEAESPEISRGCHPNPKRVPVQHHIAHVLSCMADNELEPPLLGVAWDGTGYGFDGSIWGGEFFLVTPDRVERVAHFHPFPLPGGDAAVREPRRAALGLLYEMFGNEIFNRADCATLTAFSDSERAALKAMLTRGLNSPRCCSVGRLFDVVASLTGMRQRMRFEGQAAMELEFALDNADTDGTYELPVIEGQSTMENRSHETETRNRPHFTRALDWRPMIETILQDVKSGVSIGRVSARFHNTLAESIVAVARLVGERRVVLSGGCFQNRHLTERTVGRLRECGFQPYWHQRVPPNDGGIALGQAAGCRWGLRPVLSGSSPGCGRD